MWPPNFLPWHRAYVYVFEQIVRDVSGNQDFTLPYWNYPEYTAIPEEFRMKERSEFGSLYDGTRNPGVNDGVPIDKIGSVSKPNFMNLKALSEADYLEDAIGVPLGFNNKLASELHAFVHTNVGTVENMGSIADAARDPVFWVHHCNIDRMWAAWNAYGGKNPSSDEWTRQHKHVFADANGNRREFPNGELADEKALGYTYKALPPKQKKSAPIVVSSADKKRLLADLTLAVTANRVVLQPTPVLATLWPSSSAAARKLAARPRKGRIRYLLFVDLETNMPPGVHYDVFRQSPRSLASSRVKALTLAQSIFSKSHERLASRTPPSNSPSTLPTRYRRERAGIRFTFSSSRVEHRKKARCRLSARSE